MTKKKNQPKLKVKESTKNKVENNDSTLDLSALKRFEDIEDQEFRLKKIGSKRASKVGVGQSETGDFSIITYEATDALPESKGAFITGRGFSFLRTSPIVAITDQDERSTTFETEGGIYKLEMFPTARPEPKTCHKCGTVNNYKDMIQKMGGLLCTKCHVILCEPYVDEEYFNERARRSKEQEEINEIDK